MRLKALKLKTYKDFSFVLQPQVQNLKMQFCASSLIHPLFVTSHIINPVRKLDVRLDMIQQLSVPNKLLHTKPRFQHELM
jgi:hypothetical protein